MICHSEWEGLKIRSKNPPEMTNLVMKMLGFWALSFVTGPIADVAYDKDTYPDSILSGQRPSAPFSKHRRETCITYP